MNKVILITGGEGGLGRSIAQVLSPGNQLILLSPFEEKLVQASKELDCAFKVCDVSNSEQVRKAFEEIKEEYNKIDCLINNAGIWTEGELDMQSAERIKKVIDINTLGTIYCCKEAASVMKHQNEGLIINIISTSGQTVRPGRSIYSASKWAISGFTKSIQEELAKYNIRVTGIYPGLLETSLFKNAGVTRNMDSALNPKEVAKIVEFIINTDRNTFIPDITVKHLQNF